MKVSVSIPFMTELPTLRDRLAVILSALASRLSSVLEVATITGTSGAALTEVSHTLGFVPTFVHIEPTEEVTWWVTASDRAQWTTTKVYLHFSVASVNFKGYVSRLEA